MRKRFISALLTATLLILPAHAASSAPVDIQRHWAASYINTIMEQGLMYARADGRFQPDHVATREEGAVVLYRLLQRQPITPVETPPPAATSLPESSTMPAESPLPEDTAAPAVSPLPEETAAPVESPLLSEAPAPIVTPPLVAVTFSDTAGRPSTEALDFLSALGILSGYPDGGFHPTEPLTRGALAELFYNSRLFVATLNTSTTTTAVVLRDIDGDPNQAAIQFLCDRGVLTGRPGGLFSPNDKVTRGELATAFCRLAALTPVPPLVDLPARTQMTVPYYSQIYPLGAWVGCEPTALYMGMKYKGHITDVTLKQFLDNLPFAATNPAKGFVGSPYVVDNNLRTTIYPPVLAEYGRKYGADVVDLSGASTGELQAELLAGNPAVVYLTLWWDKPYYRNFVIDGQTQSLLYNNHAVLVTGYDSATNQYHITDPYNLRQADRSAPYTYWVDSKKFETLYVVRHHAVVIRG